MSCLDTQVTDEVRPGAVPKYRLDSRPARLGAQEAGEVRPGAVAKYKLETRTSQAGLARLGPASSVVSQWAADPIQPGPGSSSWS